MSDTLQLEAREAVGSINSRRLRAEGKVPAILYGHKEDAVSLSVTHEQLRAVLKHKAKVVNLEGAASGQALLQAIQWDTFHRHLLHVDLLRVDANEKVHVTVPVELKGEAVGAREGGVVEQMLMTVEIEAAPANIPEVLHLDVTELHLGGALSVSDITDLPEGATMITGASTRLVHCVPPAGAPSLAAEAMGEEAASPEVIGKKDKEEDSK